MEQVQAKKEIEREERIKTKNALAERQLAMENRRLDLLAAMCDFLTKDISG
jgi:hypothetical protein